MAKKKRYHHGHSPHKGADIALHRLGDDFYAGKLGRTRQEHEDYTMLHEDRSAIANMPQNVIMKQYPRMNFTMDENLDDTIRVIDRQQHDDGKRQKKGPFPEKY